MSAWPRNFLLFSQPLTLPSTIFRVRLQRSLHVIANIPDSDLIDGQAHDIENQHSGKSDHHQAPEGGFSQAGPDGFLSFLLHRLSSAA